jgi:hypothetical protein
MTQYAACQADATCKAATAPGSTVDMCLCTATANHDTAGAMTCLATFSALGTAEKTFADCFKTNCGSACGF